MSVEQYAIAAIFLATIAFLIKFQKVPERVFAVSALSCLALGLVTTEELLVNAVNPGLITLLLLVVCAFSFERTSLLRRLSNALFNGSAIKSYIKTLVLTMLASGFLNNTAVVATLINPIKNNKLIPPSRLLLPLSYAAILGGTFTLIGTSTNLIVNSMLIERGEKGIAFFDFLPVGVLAAATCLLIMLATFKRLRGSEQSNTEVEDYFVEAKVLNGSNMIGKTVEENGLRNLESLFLVEIVREGHLISPVAPNQLLEQGDKLIFSGDVKKVMTLKQFDGLSLYAEKGGLLQSNLTEVVIKPGSAVIGKTLKSAGFRARFDAAVVAIRREGDRLSGKLGDIRIQSGDFFVLAVGNDFAQRTNLSKNFFILSGVKAHNMLTKKKERIVVWGFITAIAVSVAANIALLNCFIFYLALLLFNKCLSINEIKRRLPLELWLVVLGALTLAKALDNTGVTSLIAEQIKGLLMGEGVYIAFIGVFLVTLLFTEIITNNVAAALLFPIAFSIAQGLEVNYLPFVLAVAFGASGSFISPYGYQTNLMVFNAGNYQLSDFVKFGLPISLTYSLVVLTAIPIFFPF
ncbi:MULTISPECIES: SLC13 family permease [Pseudoalteromonas]|uniref:Transporter n=1 Tax=Pseudoalteromonas amylolytica TaxID=1859457 RepID=A0A1S1MZA4_9GAMM|nr:MULTISPECIES: SLC13 family permease [Pseudoalteromonas]OHU90668.1 transporter [Pseudoalteromonas sp. JW3]OHU92711.1 transporter [Pseudoalteromonas amylolytica]